MNEQTEALAKQAAEYAIEFATQDQEQYIPKLLEKFAELIVRECSKYIEDKFDFCGDEIVIAESVLKHFGVEE